MQVKKWGEFNQNLTTESVRVPGTIQSREIAKEIEIKAKEILSESDIEATSGWKGEKIPKTLQFVGGFSCYAQKVEFDNNRYGFQIHLNYPSGLATEEVFKEIGEMMKEILMNNGIREENISSQNNSIGTSNAVHEYAYPFISNY